MTRETGRGGARRRAVIALAALASAPLGALADAPPYWTHRKAIALPALHARGFVEAILDTEVYARAAPGLGDLRIRDGTGTDVAYVLRRHEKPATRRERALPLLDLQETARGEVRFVLDLGPGPPIHSRVAIHPAEDATNFRVPVRVETSPDGRQWSLVRLAGFIYAVEGETRAADTTVSYPPSAARYVRVTITPPRGRALPVEGAGIIVETRAERDEESVAATPLERVEDKTARETRLVLDLGARRPVDRVELTILDRQFHRVVTIEASDDRERWRWLGNGAVSAIETPLLRERETTLAFREAAARYLRLTIQNLDDRPLGVAGVRAAGVRRGLVFEAVPGEPYRLDYGNRTAAAPRYDLARAFPYLGSETIPVATLGGATPLPPPRQAWTEGRPILLWGAMAGIALALGGLLIRVARQIRPSTPDR